MCMCVCVHAHFTVLSQLVTILAGAAPVHEIKGPMEIH